METVSASGNLWSYPDLHGNFSTITNNSGVRQGNQVFYDPWGNTVPGQTSLANAGTGANDMGAFGVSGKVTDTSSGIVLMGARAYSPSEGRFLSVDPVEGGCANPYVYGFGDPINHSDLTGQKECADSQDVDDFMKGLVSLGLGWLGVVAAVEGASPVIVVALGIASLLTGVEAVVSDFKGCESRSDLADCDGMLLGIGGMIMGVGAFAPAETGALFGAGGSTLAGAGAISDFLTHYDALICGFSSSIEDWAKNFFGWPALLP